MVFFGRTGGLPELCRALGAASLPQKAATVVVAGPASGRCDPAAAVLDDPDGAVAKAYGMRVPRAGGPPVGYAVVDAAGAIRYRTLDPGVAERLDEVATIVSALP